MIGGGRIVNFYFCRYDLSLTALLVIPVLRPREKEMLVPIVRAFMKIDGFRDYILDVEVGTVRFSRYLYNCMYFGSACLCMGCVQWTWASNVCIC